VPVEHQEKTIVLASASPRRKALLKQLGRSFRVVAPDVNEEASPGKDAAGIALELATRKAEKVAEQYRDGLVLGADTVVEVQGRILGKPRDKAHAATILRELSGTRHAVITGLCLIDAGSGRRLTAAETTWVTMRTLSPKDIADYVASGESDGKAGAYAIQESGDRYIEKVEGSFTNVVGLPMERVAEMLAELETP